MYRMYRSLCITAILLFTAGLSAKGLAQDIKDVASYREIVKKQGPKVIVFSSVTCTACDSHMQALDEVAKKYPQVGFYSFDVGDLSDLRKELGIKYYPTTHFLPNGKKFDRSMGAAELDETVYELVHGKKKSEVAPVQPVAPVKRHTRKQPTTAAA